MNLDVRETSLPGVIVVAPKVFADGRGFFLETHHQPKYAGSGMAAPFVQDNHSHSTKGALRGLHYQLRHPQGKLMYVVRGEIFDVAVDIRKGSPTFGRWEGFLLSDKNKKQVFIPAGYAHGFYVLSETADVYYKCTDVYHPEDEYGILWSDPSLAIPWPLLNDLPPSLSEKDKKYPVLRDTPESRLPVF